MADISRGAEPQLHVPQIDREARSDGPRLPSLSNVTPLPKGPQKPGEQSKAEVKRIGGKAPPPPVKPPLAVPPSDLHSDPDMRVGRAKGPATTIAPSARPRLGASRRPLWQSPLTRRILAVNILAIAIPVVGLLYLDNYRQSLI